MAFKPFSSAPTSPSLSSSAPTDAPTTTMEILDSLSKPSTPAKPNVSADVDAKEVKAPDNQAPEDTSPEDKAPEADAADEALAGDDTATEADEGNVITVKGNGKLHKFALDKNDKKLQQTLAYGLVAPKLAEEKKALKKENEALKAQLASSGDAGKYRDAAELAQAGFLASAVKEFLGEELYKKFYNEEVVGRLDYEQASPEERIAIMEKRHARERDEYKWRLERGQKGVEQKKEADNAAKQKEAEEVMARVAASVLQQFDFSKAAKEPEAQEALKDSVWRLAMLDIEDWVESHKASGTQVTPTRKHFEKAFALYYKLLTGMRHSAKPVVGHSARGQADAAAKAASANYDKGIKSDDVKGLDPLAILKKISGRS